MFKVNISNSKQNLSWSACFTLKSEAQSWLSSQIGKPHRLPERIIPIDLTGESYDQADVLETIQGQVIVGYNQVPVIDDQGNPVLDENGNPQMANEPTYETQDISVRLKAEFISEIVDITAQYNEEQNKQQKIAAGRAARSVCESVLDLIAGYNLERNLTSEQVTQMQQTFANIDLALKSARPTLAKTLISNVAVDGTLVTQKMKDDCLALLNSY